MKITIIAYNDNKHRQQVIELWKDHLGYTAGHNSPGLVIDLKLHVADGLFFVAVLGDMVVGTVMAGYDGHRGWIYSLAVFPEFRERGTGGMLLDHAETALVALGCVKINLQVRAGNEKALAFYSSRGYSIHDCLCMGKVVSANIPTTLEAI